MPVIPFDDHHERADLYRELLHAARELDDHILKTMIVKRIKRLTDGMNEDPKVISFPCSFTFHKEVCFWKQKEFWTSLIPIMIVSLFLIWAIASVIPFLEC